MQAANNTPLVGNGSPRKQKQAGFISRLCGHGKESEDAHVPGKKWVQVFDHTGAKSVFCFCLLLATHLQLCIATFAQHEAG